MGSEIAVRANGVMEDLQWARAVAQAGIVPAAYKNRPGNLIVAAQLGRALGIHPMIAVNQIYVVDGKPSTSALLISALIRKAGHKIRYEGNTKYATVTIIRHDDPDFEFKVTWELKKNSNGNPSGEEAGLLQKDNWKKYPAGMLASRALTQCGRVACPEALLGVAHTTEELNPDLGTDEHGGSIQAERISFEDMYAEFIRNATTTGELKRFHQEAKAAGVLSVVPSGEERTVLRMLNDKMREIKANLPTNEGNEDDEDDNEGSGRPEGQPRPDVPETDQSETAAGSGSGYLNKPDTSQDDPAYDGIHDAEIVDESEASA
jgi:hypothetical protein